MKRNRGGAGDQYSIPGCTTDGEHITVGYLEAFSNSKYQFKHLTSELTQEFTSVEFEGAMDNERQETVKYRYVGG